MEPETEEKRRGLEAKLQYLERERASAQSDGIRAYLDEEIGAVRATLARLDKPERRVPVTVPVGVVHEIRIEAKRKAVVPDLFGGEHQRIEPDVKLFMIVAAQDVLDLAGDRDRHAVEGDVTPVDVP